MRGICNKMEAVAMDGFEKLKVGVLVGLERRSSR